MVVFVDLEGDDEDLQDIQHPLSHPTLASQLRKLGIRDGQPQRLSLDAGGGSDSNSTQPPVVERPNPNINGFSAALSCYPIVRSLSHHLDLNDLHSLSRTCRQFRCNLLQYHHQLLGQSLRCTYDSQLLLSEMLHPSVGDAMTAADTAAVLEALGSDCDAVDTEKRILTGKVGRCARDLVAECRKCGLVVCRNCVVKPPGNILLRGRYRRLCASCKDAPLWMHTMAARNASWQLHKDNEANATSSSSSARSFQSCSSASSTLGCGGHRRQNLDDAEPYSSFTAPAFEHGPCTCATRGVYLCQTCGQSLRSADTTYKRVWTWRSRYSTHIGGLGTGMGEGDQGQKCGQGEDCLDAVESEVEIDCSERPTSMYSPGLRAEDSDRPRKSEEMSAGYLRQEVEGIGGVVMKKVKKRVRIGATVWEYDDERGSGKYLEREATGRERSWCGWCERVVKGERDRELYGDDCFMI